MRQHEVIIRARNPDLSRSDAPESLSLHSANAYSICQYCFVLSCCLTWLGRDVRGGYRTLDDMHEATCCIWTR